MRPGKNPWKPAPKRDAEADRLCAEIQVMLANPNAVVTPIGAKTTIRVGPNQWRTFPTELVEQARAVMA